MIDDGKAQYCVTYWDVREERTTDRPIANVRVEAAITIARNGKDGRRQLDRN
jgi:hypothetical protein